MRLNDSPLGTAGWLILTKTFLDQNELNPCRNQNCIYFLAIQILSMLHVTTYIYNIYNKYFTLLQSNTSYGVHQNFEQLHGNVHSYVITYISYIR